MGVVCSTLKKSSTRFFFLLLFFLLCLTWHPVNYWWVWDTPPCLPCDLSLSSEGIRTHHVPERWHVFLCTHCLHPQVRALAAVSFSFHCVPQSGNYRRVHFSTSAFQTLLNITIANTNMFWKRDLLPFKRTLSRLLERGVFLLLEEPGHFSEPNVRAFLLPMQHTTHSLWSREK